MNMKVAREILDDFEIVNCKGINLGETEIINIKAISSYEERWQCINHAAKEICNFYVSFAEKRIEMI